MLHDIPSWHPRTNDTKGEQRLRNLNDGQYIWMGKVLAPLNFVVKDLA